MVRLVLHRGATGVSRSWPLSGDLVSLAGPCVERVPGALARLTPGSLRRAFVALLKELQGFPFLSWSRKFSARRGGRPAPLLRTSPSARPGLPRVLRRRLSPRAFPGFVSFHFARRVSSVYTSVTFHHWSF